jgi:uncharacterized protein (DUF2267 family)
MPMPQEYWHASRDFEAFMDDLKQETLLATHNMVYTMLEGVFRTFRARLTVDQACSFADELPPVLRAIFVAEWRPAAPLLFVGREVLETEVGELRRHHNFSPDNAIASVATVLRRHVDRQRFEAMLSQLPPEAREFWKGGST